jgi:hypothetical protein
VTRMRVPLLLALLVALLAALAACASAPPAAPPSPVTDSERERYATEARWAPGQLGAHFQRHPEGYRTVEEYDRGARETIRQGIAFTYVDRTTDLPRLGFYERETNRFTALTRSGDRITTHFRPDSGERYVRNLERSSYR